MVKVSRLIILLILPLALSSCFEIREELAVSSQGSGTYQLTMDFSQSRQLLEMVIEASKDEKMNPYGTEGNPFDQVDSLFAVGSTQLNSITGVSNANTIKDDNNFKYGLSFSFDNIEALNTALSEMQYNTNGTPTYEQYYTFSQGQLNKTSKFNLKSLIAQIKPDENSGDFGYDLHERIKQMYASISYKQILKFERVKKFTNESAYSMSKDKTTLTFARTLQDLQNGNVNIANEIKFK